jgi:cytochrome c oxidase cbb3-type subunit 2
MRKLFTGLLLAAALVPGCTPRSGPQLLARGQRIYEGRCARCHGTSGAGDGRYARELETPPADFTRGIFKFRSTPSGGLPRDEDLLRVLDRGIRGTAMLPWPSLGRWEKRAVVAYVKTFSKWFAEEEPVSGITIPPPSPPTDELLERGRMLYLEAGCARCHGEEGRGDGPRADELTDDYGRPTQPTDFRRGLFKTGPEAAGIYRTLVTGLDGTPMPAYADAYGPEDIWAISRYVRSLGPKWPDWGGGMMGMMRVMGSRFVTADEQRGMRIDMPGMGGTMRPFGLLGSLLGRLLPIQPMGDDMMGGWGWGLGMMVGWLFWIAVLVLVVVAIWRLLEGRGGTSRGRDESPLEILKRRYARGEIDRDEFEAKKRDLGYG